MYLHLFKGQQQLTPEQQKLSDAKQKHAEEYAKKKDSDTLANFRKNATGHGISPNSSSTTNKFLQVNTIQENPNDNCGPAATLQIAKFKNPSTPYAQSSQATPGVSDTYNLRVQEKTDSSGTYLFNIPGPLNQAAGTPNFYVAATPSTQSTLTNDIITDVDSNYPLVADVSTSYLDYYNGVSLTHYITVDGYDTQIVNGVTVSHNNAHVVDDNWNTTYLGWHWTTMSGFFGAINAFSPNNNIVF